MGLRYVVGIKTRNMSDQVAVEAEDALIAALRVKAAHPDAAITYVRKQNTRGDRRHPHAGQLDAKPDEPAAEHEASSTSSGRRWRSAIPVRFGNQRGRVEAILGWWADQRVMLEKLARPLPVGWEEKRGIGHGP